MEGRPMLPAPHQVTGLQRLDCLHPGSQRLHLKGGQSMATGRHLLVVLASPRLERLQV